MMVATFLGCLAFLIFQSKFEASGEVPPNLNKLLAYGKEKKICKAYLEGAFWAQNYPTIIDVDEQFAYIMPIAEGTGLAHQWVVESPGLNGDPKTVSLSRKTGPYAGWYLRHSNFFLRVDDKNNPTAPDSFIEDATWRMIPNKYFKYYFSFQSVNYPNRYIRHEGFILKLHPDDWSELFSKDASFLQVPSTAIYTK
ncbi:unnamed protein product [Owenia fusiformis]|uniref:Alpha-L-arabinofuranosidase B arabinose-binding domain-containing protein n=1 Tax=Owenia fusiformis TaxID=6347 RepID=A0A8S4NX80_OWEFU|nr:unnamed protein product [Owenia fusiformis]